MAEVSIRPFASGDADAFRALNLAWLTAYFCVEPKDTATLSDPEGAILAPGGQIFVAELNAQAIGCVALLPMLGGYEVAKMAVDPAAQGRGAGRKLLTTAIAWARDQGANRLTTRVGGVLATAQLLEQRERETGGLTRARLCSGEDIAAL